MSFFYDLNKRLADLAKKQDAKQISEDIKANAPKSKLAESLEEIAHDTGKKLLDKGERSSLAKQARAGKDIGKPGKGFKKVAASAAKRYGSKEAGERVAAAAMFKQAAKHEGMYEEEMDESALQAYLGDKKYGKEGMKALQKAGREHAGKEKMAKIRAQYDKMDEAEMEEGNAFSKAVVDAKKDGVQKGETIKVGGKTYPVKEADVTGLGESTCNECGMYESKCKCPGVEEGNAFTGKLAATPKGGKFKLGNKEFKDTSSLEEQEMDEGYAEMDAWLKSREKEKGTGRYDKKKISTGTVYTRKPETFDDPETEPEATGGAPKRKGRPAGTKRAIGAKHSGTSKLARKAAIAECNPEEYDQEGDMAKDNLETMVMAAKELHSILGDNDNLPEWVQAKITKALDYINASNDYLQSEKRDAYDEEVAEVAPPGAKAERMVKHIKKSLSKDGKLSGKDKAIAYATTWKAHNAGKVEEESIDKEDTKAERAGRKVTKDIEYDEKHKGKDDAKAEKAGKKVTKDIEYDDKKDKEEKVDETTTSGSVATATAAPKASKGMQFGKGVYESLNNQYKQALTESMNVTVNISTGDLGEPQKSITVTATEEDADKLAELLKMAGLEQKQETCQVCGKANCGCDSEVVDENSPDWPTNDETIDADPNLRTYSGGLNGPKSTGQTTTPVVASQLRRQVSMEEGVKIERSLFQLYKNYKAK